MSYSVRGLKSSFWFVYLLSGVKEIDIAATLEHIRDQRPGLVRTKVPSL